MQNDDEISDSEVWRAHRKHRQEKRHANQQSSTEILTARGIQFESKNAGVHLIVRHNDHVVDFWPSTGRWIARGNNRSGRGIQKLFQYLGV